MYVYVYVFALFFALSNQYIVLRATAKWIEKTEKSIQ